MSRYNIVTSENINQLIKNNSRYYHTNLGQVNTIEAKSGDRKLNDNEPFVKIYLQNGGSLLYSKGNVGNIRIFVDYYIPTNKIIFFYDKNRYEFQVDTEMIRKNGSDFYLGHLIKSIETELQRKVAEIKIQNNNRKGDPNKVLTNPGEVNYEDVVAYLEKQRLERLSVKK